MIGFALFVLQQGSSPLCAQPAADSALAAVAAMPNDTIKLRAALEAGREAYINSRMPEAKQWFSLGLQVAEAFGGLRQQALCHNLLMIYYRTTPDQQSALAHSEQAASLFKKVHDMPYYGYMLGQVAYQYRQIGDLPKAIEVGYQALAIDDSLQLHDQIVDDYYNLGIFYKDLENYPLAFEWYKKGLKKAQELNLDEQSAYASIGLGTTSKHLRRFAESEKYLMEAIRIAREKPLNNKDIVISSSWMNLGETYMAMRNFEAAKHAFQESLQTGRKVQDKGLRIACLFGLGRLAGEMHDFQTAIVYLDSASTLASTGDYPKKRMEIARDQALLYERLGDSVRAATFTRTYSALRDSIYHPADIASITDIRAAYETRLKDREIAEIRTRQTIYAGIAVGITALLLLLLYALRQRNRSILRQHKIVALEAEQQRIRAEMDLAEQTALTELRESELRYAGEMLASKNQLLLNLRELMAQNAAGNTRKLRDDLGALISAIQADLAPQPASAHPQDAGGESTNQLDILLPGFLERMQAQYPALSRNELRLAAYIRLGYSTRDIAALLSIEVGSVEVARYRLRKKLPLPQGSALGEFLENI